MRRPTIEELAASTANIHQVDELSADAAGLGLRVVQIAHMQRVLERTPRFKLRVFSQAEQNYCESRSHPEIYYAQCFAAKAAVLKALDSPVGLGAKVTDVEVGINAHNHAVPLLHGAVEALAQERGILEMHLSLSYTREAVVANAVAITPQARPKPPEKSDPRAELAAAFKNARSLLDELTSEEDLTGEKNSAGEEGLASEEDVVVKGNSTNEEEVASESSAPDNSPVQNEGE